MSNVTIGSRNPSAKTLTAQFDLSWDNSWKTKINHDAVWVTVRLNKAGVNPVYKKLCSLTVAGLNPAGFSTGNSADLELYVPQDKKGAFLRLQNYGVKTTVESQAVQLIVDYQSCGFTAADTVYLNIVAFEMVHMPRGAFYAGDYATSTAALTQGSADSDSWFITTAGPISVSNPTADG
ncbi:MAG: hypothetical protein K8I00_12845, partial [Candidatus Omnitrophica bacterium]|nr:hypothetical protein [Candidatus Omnitrophota bacterium]